ncbi:MAG: hypothetical protein OXK80_06860 [Bdellovibrionales bacterium]|nr:hypothetical protein [Bdellovibrionales bacterium]
MFSKVLFFLTAILVSCSPPSPKITPDEDKDKLSSEEESENEILTNLESSREFFRYKLTNCIGEQSDLFNNREKNGFLDISVDDGEVHISRPGMDPSLNVGLTGDWDHSNGQLKDISGQFGISQLENWSRASGSLFISNEEVSANISGLKISYAGSNNRGNIEINCSVSLVIGRKKD